MRPRSLLLAALGAAFLLGAAAPAFAQRDDWRRNDEHGRYMRPDRDHQDWNHRDVDRRDWDRHDADRRDWDRHDVDRRDWDRHDDWDRDAYAPPVVVTGPQGYYAPPPVVYDPGITFGFTLR